MEFKLRDYQKKGAKDGLEILKKHKILILNWEVRIGKSHTILEMASKYKKVLFVTKKKAMSSIESDYKMAGHDYDITIINYESLHTVSGDFDLVICDESHCIAAYPKPSKRTKLLKTMVNNDLILLTGTLCPESFSQIYHQLWISKYSPFRQYINFYKFFNDLGVPEVVYTSYGMAKSYKNMPYENIAKQIEPIKLSLTQGEAGFSSSITETIIEIKQSDLIRGLIRQLKEDKVIVGKNNVILADTAVKMMQKVHQLSSGTVKFESGESAVLDYSKANYIRDNFKGKKLAIFYKFKAELEAIKSVMDITQDLEEFNDTDKHIALQFVSGREGVNLSKADYIIAYNIDFSAVTYWQFRDRMTTIDRKQNYVYWLFSSKGIEYDIYKAVLNKKNYTLKTFKKTLDLNNNKS